MHNILKIAAIAALGVVLFGVTSCGGSHRKVLSTGALLAESKLISLQDALTELDALEKPEGVDAKVWGELKDALRKALETKALGEKYGSGELQFATSSTVSRPGGRESLSTRKLALKPPSGADNKVKDLTATRETNGEFTLSWHYRNLGDYDQNGSVGVSDISPLAQHFGETYNAQTESDSIQAVVDGSGNAKIGVEDVTQIAQNFGVVVAKYSVRGGDAYAGPFAETAIVGVSPQVSDARKVLSMDLGASPQGYWQVVPQDAEDAQGEASNTAGIALQIRSVTPTSVKEGTVVTFSADVLGAGPFTYDWDFGGQAVPATSTEASPKVVLTRDIGGFPARLTVTNYIGNAAYPFTLSKLAREWKYEVVLKGVLPIIKAYRLSYRDGKLWFFATTDDFPPKGYYIYGIPGSWKYWQANSYYSLLAFKIDGTASALDLAGSFSSKRLTISEKTESGWTETDLAPAMSFLNIGLAIGPSDDILVTYTPIPEGTTIRTLVRSNSQWLEGVLDTYASPGSNREMSYCLSATQEYSPVAVYCTKSSAAPGVVEFRSAELDETIGEWTKEKIEADGDGDIYKTGYFPSVTISPIGQTSAAYSNTRRTASSVYENRLLFAQRSGETWVKELVDETASPNEDREYNRYRAKWLAFDPTGEPVIAYIRYEGFQDSERFYEALVSWKINGLWEMSTISKSDQNDQYSISAAFDDAGRLYVLYADIANEEVILAKYE